jgi:hypothetical protein
MRMGLFVMNMLGVSSNVRIALIACYWKFFLLRCIQFLCQSRLCKRDHAYIRYLCCNGNLVTWTVVSLTATRFKPLIISVSGLALSYTANMFILMILYDFWFSPAQFCYIHREGWKAWWAEERIWNFLHYAWKSSTYLTGNILRLRYKAQPVNAV